MLNNHNYDFEKFGRILREIRKRSQITQNEIRERIGLNPNTIRKIEHGLVIPSLDTICKLSELYNVDLDLILSKCKIFQNEKIKLIINKINIASYEDNLEELETIKHEISNLIEAKPISPIIKLIHDQLVLLVEIISKKNDLSFANAVECEFLSIKALRLTKPNIKIQSIGNEILSIIEVKFLLSLAFAKSRQRQTTTSIQICEKILNSTRYQSKFDEKYKDISIQVYYSLAHFNYLLNNNSHVISACNSAISLAMETNNMRLLPHILLRKGVSEYLSDNECFYETIRKMNVLLQLQGLNDLKNKYNQILCERYNIIVD